MRKDLQYHLIAGALVAPALLLLLLVFNTLGPFAAVVLTGAAVGGLKEFVDWFSGQGTPDWLDFVVTTLGALAGAIVLVVSGVI